MKPQRLAATVLVAISLCLGEGLAASAGFYNLPPAEVIHLQCQKRNAIYYVGEPVSFSADRPYGGYTVRDYWGDIVDEGHDLSKLKPQKPGWYKLYVADTTGSVKGGTMFVVFRNDQHFPPVPPLNTPGGLDPSMDLVVRGVTGIGPQRHQADMNPPNTYAHLNHDLPIDQQYYMPFDPVRHRAILVAFQDGTPKPAAVSQIVEKYSHLVKHWEPRNEPNGGSTGTLFATKELPPFYHAVKSVDPSAKVLGPGVVTIGPPMLGWLEDFFKAGGANYIDAFSFHFYNNNNGDAFLMRKSLDTMEALLKKYHAEQKERWQTEQGSFAACYGVYQPRLQARWTMLQMMMFEQYGIPKEHNVQWYDKSHGFWDIPAWWENSDGSLNPMVALMRVWSEELYGKKFVNAFNFGAPGNNLYLGSLFSGAEGNVAAFMSTGSTDGKVDLVIKDVQKVRVVSSFGVVKEESVQNDHLILDVPEVPVYVELPAGKTLSVVPTDWGQNLARQPGVTVTASQQSVPPKDIEKINNGEFETWFWEQTPTSGMWRVDNPKFPLNLEIDLPRPQTVSRVIVYATPPWQFGGSLLDYQLQCFTDGKWTSLSHVIEPPKTFAVCTPINATAVDSFYSDRWIFQHQLKPATISKIRLVIHDSTYGGNPTKLAQDTGGQGWKRTVTIREIEIYGK